MISRFRVDLESQLQDREFAKGFGAEAAKTDFALTLAQARLSYGVTQTDLASRLGTTQSYIAKLERGDANPTIGTIGKILAVMGLRLATSVFPLAPKTYSIATPPEKVYSDSREFRLGKNPLPVASANAASGAYYSGAVEV